MIIMVNTTLANVPQHCRLVNLFSALHSDLVPHCLNEFLLLISQSQGKFSVHYNVYDCVYAEM